jgi:hypothetical protein
VIAAEIAPDLWEMAQTLRAAGLDGGSPNSRLRLPWPRCAPTRRRRPSWRSLQRFLQRHGHRCMVEAELLYPRWVEAPAQVIQSLGAYVTMTTPPAALNAAAAQRREEATAQVTARLNWFQRRNFRQMLARLHRFTRLRDNGQHYVVKLLLPMRRLYAELGRRWAARGWLAAETISSSWWRRN